MLFLSYNSAECQHTQTNNGGENGSRGLVAMVQILSITDGFYTCNNNVTHLMRSHLGCWFAIMEKVSSSMNGEVMFFLIGEVYLLYIP